MNERYCFTQREIETIMNRFGRDFFDKVVRSLEEYADKWMLTALQLIPSYSANLVFTCDSERFGSAVLKLGNPSSGEIAAEFHTLRRYNGGRFCSVFDADLTNGAILEECVHPGTRLREERSLDRRLAVFCSLHEGLHVTPDQAVGYPTYAGWVSRITDYMSKRQDCEELYRHMKRAEEICLSVAASHSRKLLLHGDFHHDNILLGPDGAYKIIDPKGVIGDPVFDVPRFILNEFGDEITPELTGKINEIVGILEQKLHIPNDVLRQCLYVETAMGICWCVEDGSTPEEYPSLLETVVFAETIMNG